MASFGFFADANLTQPLDRNNPKTLVFNVANGGQYIDFQIWFGSTDSTYKAQPVPPDTYITVQIQDTDPSAHNFDAVNGPWYQIADTQANLSSAPKNTPFSLGTEVLGGVANAKSIWIRIYEPEQNPAVYTDFVVTTNNIQVVPV